MGTASRLGLTRALRLRSSLQELPEQPLRVQLQLMRDLDRLRAKLRPPRIRLGRVGQGPSGLRPSAGGRFLGLLPLPAPEIFVDADRAETRLADERAEEHARELWEREDVRLARGPGQSTKS